MEVRLAAGHRPRDGNFRALDSGCLDVARDCSAPGTCNTRRSAAEFIAHARCRIRAPKGVHPTADSPQFGLGTGQCCIRGKSPVEGELEVVNQNLASSRADSSSVAPVPRHRPTGLVTETISADTADVPTSARSKQQNPVRCRLSRSNEITCLTVWRKGDWSPGLGENARPMALHKRESPFPATPEVLFKLPSTRHLTAPHLQHQTPCLRHCGNFTRELCAKQQRVPSSLPSSLRHSARQKANAAGRLAARHAEGIAGRPASSTPLR